MTDDQSFWALFAPGLAANIGYWITLSLNIPDFTRYARDQKSQVVGQSLAMPATMTAFSFVGIAVTAATIVIYGEAIWDPVALVARLLGDLPILLVLAMIVIVIAQLSTNMAANVVSPSNDFSNLSPRQITFRMGGLITAVIGIISLPWKLYEDVGAYIFTWLVGYGSLLAAFAGVMIVDYWILRKTVLDVPDLYRPGAGRYWFSRGYNVRALVGVAIGVIPVIPGFLQRRDDEGRRGRRPDVPRPALPLRRVRRVRAGGGLVLPDGADRAERGEVARGPRELELRQNRLRPGREERVLVGADLLHEQLVDARVRVLPERCGVGVEIRPHRRREQVRRDELARLLEVRRRRQDLRQLARQRLVRPQPVRRLAGLLLAVHEADLGARVHRALSTAPSGSCSIASLSGDVVHEAVADLGRERNRLRPEARDEHRRRRPGQVVDARVLDGVMAAAVATAGRPATACA